MHETQPGVPMSMSDIKTAAASVAEQMKSAMTPLPADLRAKFIAVRTALFQRGIYDPVLVRFDSATAPAATNAELAEQLTKLGASL